MVLAPMGTHRALLPPSRWNGVAHGLAALCATLGLIFPWPLLCLAWFAYTAGSFARFLFERRSRLRSPYEFATCIPFLFSNISAVWIVGGANDLEILGYGEIFSYYAALHGMFLGWMLVGPITLLALQERPYRRLYLASAVLCLVSFLLIALGIDGLAAIKPLGVAGLCLAIPAAQVAFLHTAYRTSRVAFLLGCVSLFTLTLTMILAWQNELGTLSLPALLGIRSMASLHGVLNGVVVAPCFMAAVILNRRERSGDSTRRR